MIILAFLYNSSANSSSLNWIRSISQKVAISCDQFWTFFWKVAIFRDRIETSSATDEKQPTDWAFGAWGQGARRRPNFILLNSSLESLDTKTFQLKKHA